MSRDWGTYRKLYEHTSASFKRLPFAVRGVADEFMRYCDRNGRIVRGDDLTGDVLEDLLFEIRSHASERDFIQSAVSALLDDGYLAFEDGYLMIRNFVKAQRSDSADRMAKLRAQPDVTSRDAQTERDESSPSDACDEPLHVRAGAGVRALVSSRLVNSPDPDPDPENASEEIQVSGKRASRTVKPRVSERPEPMPDDWRPPDEAIAVAKTQWGATAAQLERARLDVIFYWTKGKGAGTKRGPKGWVETWRKWVRRAAENGELYAEIRSQPAASRGGYSKPPGEQDHEARRLEANAAHDARKELYERALRGAFGPKVQAAAEQRTLDLARLEARIADAKRKGGLAPMCGAVQGVLAAVANPGADP